MLVIITITSACENNVSLLGIDIDFMLKFDDNVADICKKTPKQLAVQKRVDRFLTKQGKMIIYHSFIASTFSYSVGLALLQCYKYKQKSTKEL